MTSASRPLVLASKSSVYSLSLGDTCTAGSPPSCSTDPQSGCAVWHVNDQVLGKGARKLMARQRMADRDYLIKAAAVGVHPLHSYGTGEADGACVRLHKGLSVDTWLA